MENSTRKQPRYLEENEIHVKVAAVNASQVELVLYTDRTTLENILDDTYGPMNWSTKHTSRSTPTGQTEMFCEVSIWDEEKKCWIGRDDAGLGADAKIQSTDAFKRACVYWGVGRELYTLPESIICPAFTPAVNPDGSPKMLNNVQDTETHINIAKDESGSYYTSDKFRITQYKLNDKGRICALCIKNDTTGKIVFCQDYRIPSPPVRNTPTTPELTVYECVKVDVGKKYINEGKTVGQLDAKELLWVFNQTQSPEVKRAIIEIGCVKPVLKETLNKSGINPDILIKNYR